MSWDWVLAFLIIGGLVLAIWAKISQQTITELLRDLKEMMQERQEETMEVTY